MLYAFTPMGAVKWSRVIETESTPASPAVGPDGTVYVSSADIIYALNPDGSTKWSFDTGLMQSIGPATVAPDGTVYFSTASPMLYAFTPDGQMKWSSTDYVPSGFGGLTTQVCALDSYGNLYFTTGGGSSDVPGSLVSLNRRGELRWQFVEPDPSYSVKDFNSAPIVASNGLVYVIGFVGNPFEDYVHGWSKVYALDLHGTLRWRYLFEGTWEDGVFAGHYLAMADDVLYVPASNGLHAFGGVTVPGDALSPDELQRALPRTPNNTQ